MFESLQDNNLHPFGTRFIYLFVIYFTNLLVGLTDGNTATKSMTKKYIYVYRDTSMSIGRKDFVPFEDSFPAFCYKKYENSVRMSLQPVIRFVLLQTP